MLNKNLEQKLEKARRHLEHGEARQALEEANAVLQESPDHVEAYLVRAQSKRKQQHFGDALNDYHHILELDPQNERAKNCIKMINSILYIQNNHFVEDPYTDEDHIKGL